LIENPMRVRSSSIYVLASLALAACAVGPDYRRPDVHLTSTYVGGSAIKATARTSDTWWREFNDPMLDRVVERALAQSLDIAQVQARVDQARAAARAAGATLAPTFVAGGSAESVHQSLKSPIGEIAHAVGAARNYDDYSLSAEASWEIDLFGALRRGREAARADMDSAEVTAGAARISIAAEAADGYLALRGLQARLAVAEEQEDTENKLVELVRQRFEQGVSSDRELQRAIGALEGVRASVPPLRAAIDGQLNRLDVLMGVQAGTYRAELLPPNAVPIAPRPSGSLTPSDLLRRRPDVIAAERHLAAANSRIGAALAEYYPHVSLSGALGLESIAGRDLFTGDASQSAGLAGLRWRLFDFGRVDAEVAAARGRNAEALAAYRAAILRATEDVETALSRCTQSSIETGVLEREIAALRAARAETQLAYQNGAVGLIDVLDADRELLAASDQLAAAKAAAARASVAAFRALGGGWNG
jgi:NodT family efflux transporter outer membrane factor (OMF) lipoprotein